MVGGIPLNNYVWDTRWMHHALDPNDEHSLQYLASRFTAHDAWKSMRKSPLRPEQLLYNAMDATITYDVWVELKKRLEAEQRLTFYLDHYYRMYQPLFEMMCTGIRIDTAKRKTTLTELRARCAEIAVRLNEVTGTQLIAKKAISPKRLQEYLYVTKKIPRRTKKQKTTADETALRAIRLRYGPRDAQLAEAIDLILEHRGKGKLASTFLDDSIEDDDERARCEYAFTPKNGRLSSGTNPLDTGMNLQNIDLRVRNIFLPEPETVMLECDLSQAESRVVGMLTRDDELVELARTRPHEYDVHKYNASIIFGVPESEVTKEQRYIGKRAVHASNYGMRGKRLSDNLLNDGYVRTEDESQAMIDAYLRRFPAIVRWQEGTRMEVMRYRRLANSWGRVISFEHDRLNDDVYRLAYSWRPSSEVADLLNQWGLLRVRPHQSRFAAVLNLQVHDALYYSVPAMHAYDLACVVRDALEQPRQYYGLDLVIPVTFSVKRNWGEGEEIKQLTTRDAFDDVVRRVMAGGEAR